MVTKADTLALITYLSKAGYVPASDGQADVWADVINDAAPYATPDMLRHAAREIAREPHRWIATGDIVKALHRIRSEQIEENGRRQLRAVPDIDITPPERIREIIAAHQARRSRPRRTETVAPEPRD